jgi:hypothetical protein
MGHLDVSEYDLHALVDGQLTGERRHEVMAHLAARPDAAARVAIFTDQRAALVECVKFCKWAVALGPAGWVKRPRGAGASSAL